MPSRADTRVRLEAALRLAGLAALAALLWGTLVPRQSLRTVEVADAPPRLGAWVVAPPADRIHLSLTWPPAPAVRDGLAALRAAGTAVTWSGELPAVAVATEPIADPHGGWLVRVAARSGTSTRVSDGLGTLDSATAAGPGVSFALGSRPADLEVGAAGRPLPVGPADSLLLRQAVLLGMAGWEAKFTIAALEERGWRVDARLALAPGLATTQGRPLPLDTARHAVVVALDSSAAAQSDGIIRFVRTGGGLVLGPGAAAVPAFARVAPGRLGPARPPQRLAFDGGEPRRALGVRPVSLQPEGAALEARDSLTAVAARRFGAGRVVAIGYEDTWRWRMSGGHGAVAAHRAWWSSIVAVAAYRPAVPIAAASGSAPLAELVRTLGPAAAAPASRSRTVTLWPLTLALALAALMGEWASRRLRGAP